MYLSSTVLQGSVSQFLSMVVWQQLQIHLSKNLQVRKEKDRQQSIMLIKTQSLGNLYFASTFIYTNDNNYYHSIDYLIIYIQLKLQLQYTLLFSDHLYKHVHTPVAVTQILQELQLNQELQDHQYKHVRTPVAVTQILQELQLNQQHLTKLTGRHIFF